MQHNKNNTSSPPHACQDIPNSTADSLLLNCALRLSPKDLCFFQSTTGKKWALNNEFNAKMERENATIALAERFLNELRY